MNPLYITLPITFFIILYIIYRFGKYWGKRFQSKPLLQGNIQLPEKFKNFITSLSEQISLLKTWEALQKSEILKVSIEFGLITLWALIVTMPYLNFDENLIPAGSEFSSAIQTHHIWTRFIDCGWCAIWNGSVHGGYPAFVDIHGSALHPIVIITTFIWGVVNGAKISLLIAFWSAGFAQWWLAKTLKVSRLARVWTACMAIAGGQLSSRMELGAFGVVLSTAMVSLVFAALVAMTRKNSKLTIILLALTLASAILSGQGYIQVGFLFMSPAILFLLWDDKI